MRRYLVLCGGLLGLGFFSSCAPSVAYKKDFDFSKIRRVAVLTFQGPSGDAVADALTQVLLEQGVEVVERRQSAAVSTERSNVEAGKILGVDAVMTGSVLDFSPGEKYLVVLATQAGNQPVVSFNQIVRVSGRNVYSQGSALGMPNSQVLEASATVAASARLIDVQSGDVVWAATESYEGLDTPAATEGLAQVLVKAFTKLRVVRRN